MRGGGVESRIGERLLRKVGHSVCKSAKDDNGESLERRFDLRARVHQVRGEDHNDKSDDVARGDLFLINEEAQKDRYAHAEHLKDLEHHISARICGKKPRGNENCGRNAGKRGVTDQLRGDRETEKASADG